MTTELEDAVPAAQVSPWQAAGLKARHRRRRLLLGVVVLFTVAMALAGIPTGREWLTFWMLLTLFAACGGEFQVWRRAVVRDWLPLLAVLFAYDLLRGIANDVTGPLFNLPTVRNNPDNAVAKVQAHVDGPIDLDKLMFGGHVPTVWLQERYFDPEHVHWWDRLAVPVYMSHFMVSLVLAIVLWCVNYPLFRRYLAALVSLTAVTLSTYFLYPAAPPWMAALNNKFGQGLEIHRVVQETLHSLGSSTVNSAVEKGALYSNPVAAMPSLHAAIPMMLLVFFWPHVRLRGRVGLALYTLAMGVTLVYGGEHYVSDVLLGWAYAIGVVLVLRRFFFASQPTTAPVENPLTTPAHPHDHRA